MAFFISPTAELPTPSHSPSHAAPPCPLQHTDNGLPSTPISLKSTSTVNPYETDPARLPRDDPFRDMPHYGRYAPLPTDFQPDPAHIMSTTAASIVYWETVLTQHCNAQTLMLSPVDADSSDGAVALGRWIFAVGGCIVKTNHLAAPLSSTSSGGSSNGSNSSAGRRRRRRDYSGVDANETAALALVRERIVDRGRAHGVRVPRVYFTGTLLGGDVLVQERLPGVSLEVAWPYLDRPRRLAFVGQARRFLRTLASDVVRDTVAAAADAPAQPKRAYIVDDYAAVWARALTPRERKLMLPPPPQPSPSRTASGGRVGIGWGDAGAARGFGSSGLNASGRDSRNNSSHDDSVFASKEEQANYHLDHPDADTCFAHNDMSASNVIVDADCIVGVVDWEHAGWIGWRTAAALHRVLRAPALPVGYERAVHAGADEWDDLHLWKGLYDAVSVSDEVGQDE